MAALAPDPSCIAPHCTALCSPSHCPSLCRPAVAPPMQGILCRPDWEAMRHTPIAQIPCGSGNALAASVGLWTVDSAVHAVIKGHQRAFDIASGGEG